MSLLLSVEPSAMSHRALKEAFVSNLNGTSLQEVALGSSLPVVCLLNRGLMLILYHQTSGTLPLHLPHMSHQILDFVALILPLVVSCTVLSDILPQVFAALTLVSVCVFSYIRRGPSPQKRKPTLHTFLQSHVEFNQVPFVTVSRVLINVKTAISILAVDFSVYPRRYAKTETYGTGAMDLGVGLFVFANALVCPEARNKMIRGAKANHILKQLVSVWPLVVLGMARLVSVKMTDYPEHVTEYGVHWNFFFTLATVRVLASLLLTVLPVNKSLVLSLLISVVYQVGLETTGLKDFIIHNNDRERDFLHANKEGVFSIVGYVSIYLAGVQVGHYVLQQRSLVKEWLKTLLYLFVGSCVLYAALYTCQTLVEPVSRRLANLSFCLWSVAQSLLFISCLGFVDMVLLFAKTTSGCHDVPSSWNLHQKQPDSDTKTDDAQKFCLIQAIGRNQLFFFLFANVMTGLTNSMVETLSCSSSLSVCILLMYMFTNCFVMYVLHLRGITVKFW